MPIMNLLGVKPQVKVIREGHICSGYIYTHPAKSLKSNTGRERFCSILYVMLYSQKYTAPHCIFCSFAGWAKLLFYLFGDFLVSAETKDLCSDEPCKNGGTCVLTDKGHSFNCTCTKWFMGDRCEIMRGKKKLNKNYMNIPVLFIYMYVAAKLFLI